MNVLIYKYNPINIGLTKEIVEKYDINIIAPDNIKEKYEIQKINDVKFISKNEFNFATIWNELKNLNQIDKIDDICILAEEQIEFGGILKDFYNLQKTPNMLTSFSYRDKYFMRVISQGIANQPKFKAINSKKEVLEFFEELKKEIIIKPRNLAGSEGIRILKSKNDIDINKADVENINAYLPQKTKVFNTSYYNNVTFYGPYSDENLSLYEAYFPKKIIQRIKSNQSLITISGGVRHRFYQ